MRHRCANSSEGIEHARQEGAQDPGWAPDCFLNPKSTNGVLIELEQLHKGITAQGRRTPWRKKIVVRPSRPFGHASSIFGPGRSVGLRLPVQLNVGEFPFTRGVFPTMYRSELWTMRQYSGQSTSESTNERFKYLLKNGQTGLSLAFDLPTQIGLDSDMPQAEDDVGKLGVAVDTLDDFERIYEGISLDGISTSFTINAIAPIIWPCTPWSPPEARVRTRSSESRFRTISSRSSSRGTWIFPSRRSSWSRLCRVSTRNAPANAMSVSGRNPRIRSEHHPAVALDHRDARS